MTLHVTEMEAFFAAAFVVEKIEKHKIFRSLAIRNVHCEGSYESKRLLLKIKKYLLNATTLLSS